MDCGKFPKANILIALTIGIIFYISCLGAVAKVALGSYMYMNTSKASLANALCYTHLHSIQY